MRTTEEIIEKVEKMMEEELKAFIECNEAREWAKNKGLTIYAEDMKNAIGHHQGGYARLSELLDYIYEK